MDSKQLDNELSTHPRTLLAIAGNYNEFRMLTGASWQRYRYLFRVEDIRGLANAELDLMGTWWRRQDMQEHIGRLREYCARHQIAIREQR